MKLPHREYLIDPWLRQGESMLLYGGPGVGKSMFSLSLALAVAGGGRFLNWTFPQPRNVLLFDGEMAIDDLKNRCGGLLGGIENTNNKAVRDNLTILSRQNQEPDAEFPDISQDEGRAAIFDYAVKGIGEARGRKFDLVILDNLSTLALDIQDENAAAEFNPVMKLLMTLKQSNVACILVHHTNKKGENYRGTSKIATTFEVIIGMKPMKNPPHKPGTHFTMVWEKFRDMRPEDVKDADVNFHTNGYDEICWNSEVTAREEASIAVQLARTCEYKTQADIAKAMEISVGKMSGLKNYSISEGLIDDDEWNRCLREAREKDLETEDF